MIKFLSYCLFVFPFVTYGQFSVGVNLTAGGQLVSLNQEIGLNDRTFQLEQVRFYLSKFEFYRDHRLVFSDPVEAYLIDFENDSTRKLVFPDVSVAQFDEVRFLFGIDSLTNTSGAMSGALDPMHGMYWSWQSGYINCKIEGTFRTPKPEAFQLHLGGYASPFSGARHIVLQNDQSGQAKLSINLDALMQEVLRPESKLQVMSPCSKAVEYATLLAKSFELKP